MSYKPPDKNVLAVHVLKFGDSGPELVASWSKDDFFENKMEERSFAVKQGVVLMTIQQFSLGLSGPFPVSGMDIKCMVYAWSTGDLSLQDARFKQTAYTYLVFYFPLSLEHQFLSKKSQLEHALFKLTVRIQDISEVDEEFLTLVEVQIHEVLYQMELVILGANMKLLLNLRKEMKWLIYADEDSNYQEMARQLLYLLFDKVDSYHRTLSRGLTTSSTIKTFSNRLTIETLVISKSKSLEAAPGENNGCPDTDSDIAFFLIPHSYSLDDNSSGSAGLLEVLGNCDEQNPVVVFIEQVEGSESSTDTETVTRRKSLTHLKQQLLKATTAPLLVLSGMIDQGKLLEAMKWAIDQYARKIGVPIVQFDHLKRKQQPM